MRVLAAVQRALPILLPLPLLAASLQAQKIGAVRGWFSSPDCVSGTLDEPIREDEPDNPESETDTFEERARRIADALPPGRAKELALSLESMLSHRDSLKYLCKDNSTGEYVVSYPEGLGTDDVSESKTTEFRMRLPNLSDPEIEFSVNRTRIVAEDRFLYSYRISNKASALASILGWQIVTSGKDLSLEFNHPEWGFLPTDMLIKGAPAAPQAALFDNYFGPELLRMAPPGRYAGWWAPAGDHLQPGEAAESFSVTSSFRPGWTTAYIYGASATGIPGSSDELPSLVREELVFLRRVENKTSVALVIGPMFGPDAVSKEIGANWGLGIRQLVSHGWLSGESPYVAEIKNALGSVQRGDSYSLTGIESPPSPGLEALLDRILRLAL